MTRTKNGPGPLAERVLRGIIELGPRDLKRVAQLSGVPYHKTVKVYNRILQQFKIKISAAANAEALGLVHAFFTATPNKDYRKVALESLAELHSLLGLAVDSSDFFTIFGALYLPANEKGYDYLRLFESLRTAGFLTEYTTNLFTKKLRYNLRPEYVNWETGKYDFEWDKLTDRQPEDTVVGLVENPSADKIDLLVLKELELNATKTFKQMQEGIKERPGAEIAERLLLYHFSEHVVRRKLLSRYKVYFPVSECLAVYLVASLKPTSRGEYLKMIRRIPYLSIEFLSEQNPMHVSVLNIPGDAYSSFLSYFNRKVLTLTEESRVFVAIPGMRHTYTIPYELYNEDTNSWDYDYVRDAESVLQKAETLIQSNLNLGG
jgi:hypothetical protein